MNHHELVAKYGDKILTHDRFITVNKQTEWNELIYTDEINTYNNYYDEKDSIIFGALRCTRIMFVLSVQYHSGRKDGFYSF